MTPACVYVLTGMGCSVGCSLGSCWVVTATLGPRTGVVAATLGPPKAEGAVTWGPHIVVGCVRLGALPRPVTVNNNRVM